MKRLKSAVIFSLLFLSLDFSPAIAESWPAVETAPSGGRTAGRHGHGDEADAPDAGPELEESGAAKACTDVIGSWLWFDDGIVSITADRRAVWHTPGTNAPAHTAKLQCNAQTKTITFPWTNGIVDVVHLSAGGQSVLGKNNLGLPVWAERRP